MISNMMVRSLEALQSTIYGNLVFLLALSCSVNPYASGRTKHSPSFESASPRVNIDNLDLECLESPPMMTNWYPEAKLKKIEGVVRSEGSPLADVSIFLEPFDTPGKAYLETSIASGEFSFTGVPEGHYRLWTCMTGWDSVYIEIHISDSGHARPLSIELSLGS